MDKDTKNVNSEFDDDEKFKKYKGVYTNYAIYIDAHIPDIAEPYKNPLIENKVLDYIYRICYVLACKRKYFQTNFSDYNDFAWEAASKFYLMFRDKYVHRGEVRRGKVVEPIKSSLNTIKMVLDPFKVEYMKSFFADSYSDNWKKEDSPRKILEDKRQVAMGNFIEKDIQSNYDHQITEAVCQTLSNINKIIRDVLDATPYKSNSLIFNRIYKSCLLSFLNKITLPNTKKNLDELDEEKIIKRYKKEEKCIILWHLDASMYDYVDILLTRIKEKLAKEIEDDKARFTLDSTTINNILDTAYSTYDIDQSNDID